MDGGDNFDDEDSQFREVYGTGGGGGTSTTAATGGWNYAYGGGGDYSQFSQTQKDAPKEEESDGEDEGAVASSQLNPRKKYWAVFSPIAPHLPTIKLHWAPTYPTSSSAPTLLGATGQVRLGRGPVPRFNDVKFEERRVSNKHCVIFRVGNAGEPGPHEGEEPVVCIEDLKSSNGTWVNGKRIAGRHILSHGDEVSLGSQLKMEDHDVRYIFRSVGKEGEIKESVGGVFEHYHFRETLGSGTFAEVKKAIEIETGITRAIKCITKHRFASNPKTLQLFEREVDILENLKHENICQLIEVWDDPQHIYLVLEYVDGGDLLEYIMGHQVPGPGLTEQQAIELTRMICKAMAYTHDLNVTHRDLKPENILLTSDDPPVIKVADFGLAKMVDEGTALRTMVGTPQYLAPEIVMQSTAKPGYENVVDSWSVGVIVYSMMTNAMPFDEDPELPVQVRIRSRFDQDFDRGLLNEMGLSDDGMDFISKLLEKDPAYRMKLSDAVFHPWLNPSESQESSLPASYAHGFSLGHPQGNGDSPSRASTANGDGALEDTPRLGFGPTESSNSTDDYSLPMTNLRLRTPGNGVVKNRTGRSHFSMDSLEGHDRLMAGQSSFFGGGAGSSGAMEVEDNQEGGGSGMMDVDGSPAQANQASPSSRPQVQPPQSLVLQESPPSPPLTVAAMEEDENRATPATRGGRAPMVAEPSTAVKRKLAQANSASSSDLSSAPESHPAEQQPSRALADSSRRPRKKAANDKASVANPVPAATRSSARIKKVADDEADQELATPRAKKSTRRSR